MKVKYLLILLVLPVISFYCSSSKEIKEIINNAHLQVSDLVTLINNKSDKLKSLKGSGSLTIEAPGEANSGSFTLNLLKPDSVSLKINGPFGINAAKIFVSRDTFIFYNAFENTVVTGKTSSKNLGSLLNLKIDYDEILSILSCFPDFHREGLTAVPSDSLMDNQELILVFPGTDIVNKYWVNQEGKYITKRVTFNEKSKVIREERYQNYKMIDNNWMPKSIQIILHAERQSLSLFYDKQEVNTNNLDFGFNIPDGIKIVHWK